MAPCFFLSLRYVRGRWCRLGAMPKWAFDCVAYCQGELQTRPCRAQTVQFLGTLYSSNAHFGKAPSRHPLPLTVYWQGKKQDGGCGWEQLRREGVTQRLGREADGNYVCLALCTGRKRWLIPFGETFVFTIFYSFVYFQLAFFLSSVKNHFCYVYSLSGVYFA